MLSKFFFLFIAIRRFVLLSVFILLVLGAGAFWWYGQYGVVITPQRLLGATHHHLASPLPWATHLLTFTAPDGVVLHGVEVVKPDARATVLYIGGIGFTIDQYGHLVKQAFDGIPVNVVVYDPRGFGRSGGQPSLLLTGQDLLAIYHHLKVSSTLPLIVHGHSLGTFLAAYLGANTSVGALVLEAPGTTPAAFVRFHLPWFLKWATIHIHSQALQEANVPRWLHQSSAEITLIAGTEDHVLPYQFAEQIKNDLPLRPLDLIKCSGANHDNMWQFGCFKTAYQHILTSSKFVDLSHGYLVGQTLASP